MPRKMSTTGFDHKIDTYKDLKQFISYMENRNCPDDTKVFFERVDNQKERISNKPLVIHVSIWSDEREPMSLVFADDSEDKLEF